MRVRVASVSPSMERWGIARLAWPARCWTSRLPPASEALQAARGMKVRRPEGEEQPVRPRDD